MLDVLYSIFQLKVPVWTEDYREGVASIGMFSNTISTYTLSFPSVDIKIQLMSFIKLQTLHSIVTIGRWTMVGLQKRVKHSFLLKSWGELIS